MRNNKFLQILSKLARTFKNFKENYMVIKQKGKYRIIIVDAYYGCLPITAYMIQKLEERTFLPDKWVNVKGYEDKEKAETLFFKMLT